MSPGLSKGRKPVKCAKGLSGALKPLENTRKHIRLTICKIVLAGNAQQKWTCTRPECGRKLASKRSFDAHKLTCGVEKRFFCRKKGCKSRFATKEGLAAHQSTHKKLSKKEGVCKFCKKEDFKRAKSLKDHIRYCEKNPDHVGPFPCPIEGCHRGVDDPFNRTRNLNQHLKNAHDYDPKHKF